MQQQLLISSLLIHAERHHRGAPVRIRHGQLQLYAVGTLHEPQHLLKLLIGEIWGGGGRGHSASNSTDPPETCIIPSG